jgi:hypothetical protein
VPVDRVERKLAAVFAADIAGYSRLMARDEVGTLVRLKYFISAATTFPRASISSPELKPFSI